MEPHKPLKSDSLVATEQQQPPQGGLEEAASSRDVAASKKSSTSSRTSMSSRASKSSRTSVSSRISVSSRASTSSRTSMSSRTSVSSRTSKRPTQQCMILMAETYPPRQEVRRTGVPKADKAIQTPRSFDATLNKRHTRLKKKIKSKDVSSDQDQLRASRDSSAMEVFPQAVGHRTPSPPEVTPQHRRSEVSSNTHVDPDEEGWEDQAVLEVEGYEADVHSPGTVMGDSQGICPAEEETQEGLKHVQAHEGGEVNPSPLREADGSFQKEGKQVDVGELKSHPAPMEVHLLNVDHHQALGDVPVNGVFLPQPCSISPCAPGDAACSQDLNSSVGTGEVTSAREELQQIVRHAAEETDFRDSQGSDPAEELDTAAVNASLAGDEEKIQDLLDPTASKVHLSSQEIHETLRHMEAANMNLSKSMKAVRKVLQTPLGEEDKDDVSSEGSIPAALSIHSALEELKEAQVNEKAALAPGHVPQTRVATKLSPKNKALNPLEIDTASELPEIPQTRVESEAVKNMTKKQQKAFSDAFNFFPKDLDGNINLQNLEVLAKQLGISFDGQEAHKKLVCADADGDKAMNFSDFLTIITDKNCFIQTLFPDKNDAGNFDHVDARGILLLKVLLKLVELEALPQRTLFHISSYYQQKFRDCSSEQAWTDADFLVSHKKNNNKNRKVLVYPLSSFVSAARISLMKEKEATAYLERLKERVPESESPYARVPVFPLISKQDAKTLVKPKKDMQKQTKQRKKEPLASKESRFSCKKKQVQEAAAKASAQSSKKKLSSAVNSERPNKRRHPPAAGKGKTQARDVQVAQRYRRNLALRKHASLLKLWHKINGAQISRQTGSRRFCHTFSTYSWSWNACRELVTAEELQAQDRRHRRFQPATRQPPWKKWLF
ncbi:EF-hand calcium-binding domain-containing protein 3 isoform X1 [Gallus gallus]|uniref:EF-hand calcium-binding domain-containing protein 3 isoform X1 n=1 Tax=Gallus gallus TaxID=9031 RepID=UPI001AE4C86F|nr:EF-hand calcium-binding domain-containing protein 3 isoform X1 [Gallus gallus]XP_040547783.1 EF-hand calcium-binding domain-containing protein 3 isoform X1 [Gallus gallus]XP_040547784.1 EF-hand calcium-binding domain-containing protein 3 isoform X1 [Gallus gallus]